MTYSYRPLTSLTFIDAAPLAARYHMLMGLILTLITAGRIRDVERLSRQVARLVKAYVKVGAHNALISRKLDMLADPNWRGRVLKDLGGLRKLKLWDAAFARVQKEAVKRFTPVKAEPAWLDRPERIAESERLKARSRAISKACVNPKVFRDAVKVDMDGMFRLAPLPRRASIGPCRSTNTKTSGRLRSGR